MFKIFSGVSVQAREVTPYCGIRFCAARTCVSKLKVLVVNLSQISYFDTVILIPEKFESPTLNNLVTVCSLSLLSNMEAYSRGGIHYLIDPFSAA